MARWVRLAEYRSMMEAQVVRSLLEGAGIAVRMPGEGLSSLGFPAHRPSFAAVEVQVLDEELADAEAVLAAAAGSAGGG